MADSPKVRVREPRREGQQIVVKISEDSLPLEHPARLLWEVLGLLDLSAFVAQAKAVQGGPGGSLKSRRMLLTLWAYALTQRIVSAREIERKLRNNDHAFRWIAGDQHVSHTLLSEFLVDHLEAMQALFTNVLGALQSQGLLFLPGHRTAQDGTRVGANAGKASFRTRAGLESVREQAELHLKAVLARLDAPSSGATEQPEADDDDDGEQDQQPGARLPEGDDHGDPPLTEAQQQARERGAMDVLDRVKKATKVVQELQEKRSDCRNKKRQSTEPKASTTDPEARIMKVSNGGFEPAYNVQLAAMGSPMGGPITIIGVQVTSLGSDKHSILPMCEQVEQRTGHKLDEVLVDGEHLTQEELLAAIAQGRTVIAPVPERWDLSEEPQNPTIAAWMAEMKTDAMRRAYRTRKALVEHANAILKDRFGLRKAPVRGTRGVLCVFLLAAVVLNLTQHGLSLLT
jgi:transposase